LAVTALDVVGVLARRQDGVVSRAQLVRAGLTPSAIKHLLATRRLVAIHRGVYAVGHAALSDRGRILAAPLRRGPQGGRQPPDRAYLDELIPTLPAVIDVTTTANARRSRPTLTIHEATPPIPTRRRHGIPVTAPLRTLADLGFPHELVSEALAKRLITPDELPQGIDPTRSKLEKRFLALIRRAGLPEPKVNHRIGPYLADFAWPEQKVVVETDGYATHGHRAAFESDRARDAALQAAGYAVLRFTHRQIARQPLTVIARLAAVLLSR
jgi:very-short-patch-repair endonuclease